MSLLRLTPILVLVAAAAVLTVSAPAPAADASPDGKQIDAVVKKAAEFLKTRQEEGGGFGSKLSGPGISSLIAAGLIRTGASPDDPLVAKALAFMEKSVQKDGGIYDKVLANYSTCVALVAFQEANSKGKYGKLIQNAATFLKTIQFDDSIDEKDVRFGGVGYNKSDRPDLSNTQYFVDALIAAGVPKTDPAIQKALKFISRCQNLPGETNDQLFAKKTTSDDRGGLTYNPIDNEKNPARTPDGGLRSSGVMTYAGLKSFLHAGMDKNDPRVKAAVDWIRRHYSLDENPGQGTAGLFYYYHTFGKAMTAVGEDELTDKDGKKHNWRQELFDALKKRQKPDGSWANENTAFYENNPDLATAYAILALSYCKPPKK